MKSEQSSSKPFPDIARFPEREERTKSDNGKIEIEIIPQEPPLEGPPKSPEESIFYIKPETGRVVEMCRQYDKANSEKRHTLISQITRELANNPDSWENFYDGLAIIQEESKIIPDFSIKEEKIEEIKNQVAKGLEHPQFAPFPPEPRQLEKWLTLVGESALYEKEAETMLRKMIEKCKNPEEITDFFYNLSLAGLTSSNDNIVKKTLEIFCLKTNIIKKGDKQLSDHLLASFDLDDNVLKKAMEIDHATLFVAGIKELRPLLDIKSEILDQVRNDENFVGRLNKIAAKNPERLKILFNLYESQENEYNLVRVDDVNAFPFTLTSQPGPLREFINELIAQELERQSGQPALNLHLPDHSGAIKFQSNEDIIPYIIECLNKPNQEQKITTGEKHWQTLTHLTPKFSNEQLKGLTELNRRMADDLKYNTRYLLNPSGDKIIITDPTLINLGFKYVQFDMDPRNRRDTIITLMAGNFPYSVILDEFIALKNNDDLENSLNLPKNGSFLIYMILSHLHAIRCHDATEIITEHKNETSKNGKETLLSRPRRAHIRRLPKGHKPTAEQIEWALKEYDIDLIRINKERELRGLELVTFVSEVKDINYKTPLVSRATAKATEELEKILKQTN